jgi:hypothetical protein
MAFERIQKLFNEIGTEYREKLSEAEKNEEIISEKLKNSQEKLVNVVKLQCKEPYDWFQNNSTQEMNENGVSFQIDESKREDSQRHLEQLQKCFMKYDYGLRDELIGSQNEMNKITDDHESCSNFCIETSEKKPDQEVKQCFQNCFNQTFVKTSMAQSRIIGKIDEVYNILDKI